MDLVSMDRQFSSIRARLRAVEAQLAILSERAGVPYSPPDDVPAIIRELAATGKKLDAIRELRAATGMDLLSAKELVEQL